MDQTLHHPAIGRKRLGFVQAPRIEPGAKVSSSLPVWIQKIIAGWQPTTTVCSKQKKSVDASAVGSSACPCDFGSAAMDFTGKEVDETLDDMTQRALLDGAVCKQASRLVRRAVKEDCIPITFCAGRIPALGSISGHGMGRADRGVLCVEDASSVCLVWLDLFANMDPRMSHFSAYLTRCPAAFLLHELFPGVPRDSPGFEWIRPWLSVKRAALIGLQNPTDNEIRFLEEWRLQYCTADELGCRGAEDCITPALRVINPRNDLPVHLTINVFALDLKEEPFSGSGIGMQDLLVLVDAVLRTGKLGAVDFLEVDQIVPGDIARASDVIKEILKRVSMQINRQAASMSFEL